MAPVCLSACRLLREFLPVRLKFCLLILLLLLHWNYSIALRIYDRQSLLHIKDSLDHFTSATPAVHHRLHPTFIQPPLECIRRLSCCSAHRKKRRKRRGKRGGLRVKIRSWARLAHSQSGLGLHLCHDFSSGRDDIFLTRRSWDLIYSCHVSAAPLKSSSTPVIPARPRLRIRSGGINPRNIRSLDYSPCRQAAAHFVAKAALVNCRSVLNKTFILNDFFCRHDLDLLLLTETWIVAGVGESAAFGELCPTNCSFVSTPRCVGRGGGVALVYKNAVKIRSLPTETYSTFELQCMTVESKTNSLVCVLIYRPPKPDKDFIAEFSGFLSHFVSLHDRLLVLGDFNIHVCCPDKPMVKEFCDAVNAFGLTQHIHQATHLLGHTLDLVLSYGFSVGNIMVEETSFSDHLPVLFNFVISNHVQAAKATGRYSRCINSRAVINQESLWSTET